MQGKAAGILGCWDSEIRNFLVSLGQTQELCRVFSVTDFRQEVQHCCVFSILMPFSLLFVYGMVFIFYIFGEEKTERFRPDFR